MNIGSSRGFVGRADERRVLHESLRAARRGEPRIVVVEGEPGIGKTALLRRFAQEATDVSVLWTSGEEMESSLEFGVADQLRVSFSTSTRDATATDSMAVGAELLAGISALEQDGAVVLVVDDLQWADLASTRALLFCLRRLRTDLVLVLLATRPHALDHLGGGWGRLLADGGVTHWIRLAGLTSSEVTALAATNGQDLTPAAGARLREHTAGSPLYVSALLAELSATALRDDAAPLPAPHSYAATVLSRLARLSRPAQEFVSVAAVLGIRAPMRAAAAMVGPTDSPLTAAVVDEAIEARLLDLVTTNHVDEVVFGHPLVRAAVYEDLAPARRRRLHLAAAALVTPPLSFRHRVRAAIGEFDDQLAGELAAAADHEQSGGALRQAAEYLLAASRVASDTALADRCLFRAVELLLLAGDVGGAESQAARVQSRPDTPYRRYTLALMATPTGQLAHSADELREIAESVASGGGVLFGRCASALAFISAMLGDDDAAIHWATRARRVAGNVPTVDTMAHQALAWGYAKTGHIRESLALLTQCAPDAARPAAFETELLAIRGTVHNWAGDVSAAVTDLRGVLRWAQLGYPLTDISLAYASLAEAEFRAGDWNSSATHVEIAVSLAEDLDHRWYLAYARSVAAALYAARGDDTFAAAHARAAALAAAAGPSIEASAYAALAQAHVAWATGSWPAVVDALRPFEHATDGMPIKHPNLGLWRYRLAEAFLLLGRRGDASRLLVEAGGTSWGGATASDRARLTGLLYRHNGEVDRADDAFRRGLAEIAPISGSFADGLLVLEYGRWLVETRRRKAAVRPLIAARDVLGRLGASRHVSACDEALALCGVPGTPHRDGSDPSRGTSLTAREQMVVRMVATGMTNREVAADLYLSEKAIEYHLGNIFAKLGLRSRRQLRGALPAGGWHEPTPSRLPQAR